MTSPATLDIGAFTTEAGVTIPEVTIAYRRWGHGRTVLLVEHALTGDSDVPSWWHGLLGPGLALDTAKYTVLCTNVLGGCGGTTGPSSPHQADDQAWGSRFPAISIRDQVRAERQFLDRLGVQPAAVIGGSMGGARALEWTLLFPDSLRAALVLAVSARASAWQIGIQAAQITAIEQDPNWSGGDFYGTGRTPERGLGAARRIAHLTYRGELELDERFGTDAQGGEDPYGAYRRSDQRFSVQSYLDHQAGKLVRRFDAGSYVVLTDALNRHDIGRGRGGLNKALASSTVPTMVAGVDTDILYPYHQQEHLSRNLGVLLGMHKISSPVGHDAFLTETRQLDFLIRNFLRHMEGCRPVST